MEQQRSYKVWRSPQIQVGLGRLHEYPHLSLRHPLLAGVKLWRHYRLLLLSLKVECLPLKDFLLISFNNPICRNPPPLFNTASSGSFLSQYFGTHPVQSTQLIVCNVDHRCLHLFCICKPNDYFNRTSFILPFHCLSSNLSFIIYTFLTENWFVFCSFFVICWTRSVVVFLILCLPFLLMFKLCQRFLQANSSILLASLCNSFTLLNFCWHNKYCALHSSDDTNWIWIQFKSLK